MGRGNAAAAVRPDGFRPYGTGYSVIPSPSGERVVVRTEEALVGADTDGARDLYLVEDGNATLITSGSQPAGGLFEPALAFLRDDGRDVYFNTDESLVPEDIDGERDGYLFRAGTTTLLTPDTAEPATLAGASADATRLFLVTKEPLEPLGDFRDSGRL